MCDVICAASPFRNCFFTGIDREPYAFLHEEIIEHRDARGFGLINERMVDVAYRSASVDAGVTIDCEDLLEPGVASVQISTTAAPEQRSG